MENVGNVKVTNVCITIVLHILSYIPGITMLILGKTFLILILSALILFLFFCYVREADEF